MCVKFSEFCLLDKDPFTWNFMAFSGRVNYVNNIYII